MYKMSYFTEANRDAVISFMKEHPFVTLIGSNENIPVATQIPVLLHEEDGEIILRGHIMRKTDHHIAFTQNPEALVLFQGAHCYVSASWYTERGHGSTWNYMTVHARGEIRFMDDAFTLQLLKDLTHTYEDSQKRPELVEHMSEEQYVLPALKAIAGFEIRISSLYPIFKLSQNRDAESRQNIIRELHERGDHNSMEIAREIEQRRT